MAAGQIRSNKQLFEEELRLLDKEARDRRDEEEERAEKEAALKLEKVEQAAAETMQAAAEALRQAEEKLRQVDQVAAAKKESVEVTPAEQKPHEAAFAEVEKARAEASRAAEEARQAKAQAKAELEAQKVKLEAEHQKELKRRTGALAERHAQAMSDRSEKHAAEMQENKRQFRMAETAASLSNTLEASPLGTLNTAALSRAIESNQHREQSTNTSSTDTNMAVPTMHSP